MITLYCTWCVCGGGGGGEVILHNQTSILIFENFVNSRRKLCHSINGNLKAKNFSRTEELSDVYDSTSYESSK